jgi:alpha-L-fucosidase
MKFKNLPIIGILSFVILSGCSKNNHQSLDKMEWWKEAKFGMFIHWGIYSVPAGKYQGKQISGIGEWIMNRGKIPVKEYARYANEFNPEKFDAEKWVKLAKDAGMKYIIITSKHHDGFAMFRSKVSDYNIYDATPYKRDPLKELAKACKKNGLRLGFYYSQAQDWHHAGGSASGGHWDSMQIGDMDKYIEEIAVPQVKEILKNYGEVSVLWWDTPIDMTKERAEKFLPLLDLQPGIIYNDRLGGGYGGDLETPEQHIPETGIPGKNWEACMTMNNTWGYKSYDQNWKSSKQLIHNLIDIASKGGNYLLNVGPTALGEIPDSSVIRLEEIGNWMSKNSESIYGTQASPFENLPWGKCTQKQKGKNTLLYLHIFDFPKNGLLELSGLDNNVNRIYALEDEAKSDVPYVRKGVNYSIDVKSVQPNQYATVIVMEINGNPVVYKSPDIKYSSEIFTDSLSIQLSSSVLGSEIHYTLDGTDPNFKSEIYTSELKLTPDSSFVIKCAAFKNGKLISGNESKKFYKVKPISSLRKWLSQNGVSYKYYEGVWEKIPNFSILQPVKSGFTDSISISQKEKSEEYALTFLSYLKIPTDGVYTFYLESDDGSKMFINNQYEINNDGRHAMQEKSIELALEKGFHKIDVQFFQAGGNHGLNIFWKGPGIEKQIIGEGHYYLK